MNKLDMAGTKIGLDMNMNKTKVMVRRWCATGTGKLSGTTLQQVDSIRVPGKKAESKQR